MAAPRLTEDQYRRLLYWRQTRGYEGCMIHEWSRRLGLPVTEPRSWFHARRRPRPLALRRLEERDGMNTRWFITGRGLPARRRLSTLSRRPIMPHPANPKLSAIGARLTKTLNALGITSVRQLTRYSREQLMKAPGLGDRTVDAIEDFLRPLGLFLRITDNPRVRIRCRVTGFGPNPVPLDWNRDDRRWVANR